MEVINYTTDDLVMIISCHYIDKLYRKASFRKDMHTATKYQVYGATGQLAIWYPAVIGLLPVNGHTEIHPVFFENADYHFDISFTQGVKNPRVYSRLKEITERFSYRQRTAEQTLTGTINYGNDIGECEFVLQYTKGGVEKKLMLRFEVFPTKLDFKHHYKIIVLDVEEEYSRLALDILKKTYLGVRSNPGEGNDLTWWSIFESIFKELIKAMWFILNRPHSQLVTTTELRKRGQLKRLNLRLEEELVRHRNNPTRLYQIRSKSLSHDTLENRFLKYLAGYVYLKFTSIQQYIKEHKKKVISKDFNEEMDEIGKELKKILVHPFFKGIREFKGMRQESAVLQKKAGYSAVYRNWILLKRSLQLFEGIQKIETKNIADLYQFWCFLKMKNALQSLVGKDPEHIDLARIQADNFLFTLKKGKASRILFISDTGDKIELYHDLSYSKNGNNSYANLVFTEDQRPDITLKITKNDLYNPYVFTFLYDVKYRLEPGYKETHNDSPPRDAIDQIHRYRDAIYHLDNTTGLRGKEVIGGYILFPGSGSVESIKKSDYFTSIETVNVGGFPLLPDDKYDTGSMLKAHLREILEIRSDDLLKKVIPQKGLQYADADAVILICFPSGPEQAEPTQPDGTMVYCIPVLDATGKPNAIDLHENIRYFAAAYAPDRIYHYYKVDKIVIRLGNEVLPALPAPSGDDNALYYVFSLSDRRELGQSIQIVPEEGKEVLCVRLSRLRGG